MIQHLGFVFKFLHEGAVLYTRSMCGIYNDTEHVQALAGLLRLASPAESRSTLAEMHVAEALRLMWAWS